MPAEVVFTERETKMMAHAWMCFDEQPKINYDKLAELCGMSNPRSASNAWSAIKKKLVAMNGESAGTTNGGTPKTPKSGGKRKKAAAEATEQDDNEHSPTKKPKTPIKGKRGNNKSATEVMDDTDKLDGVAAVKDEGNADELV